MTRNVMLKKLSRRHINAYEVGGRTYESEYFYVHKMYICIMNEYIYIYLTFILNPTHTHTVVFTTFNGQLQPQLLKTHYSSLSVFISLFINIAPATTGIYTSFVYYFMFVRPSARHPVAYRTSSFRPRRRRFHVHAHTPSGQFITHADGHLYSPPKA